MPDQFLELQKVYRNFGGLQAVLDCSFTVDAGTITGLIGPNGAGKTTVTNLIAGEMAPSSGHILFHGRNIAGHAAHVVARAGVARTFQLARELGRLTVMENLLLAPYPQKGENLWNAIVQPRSVREEEKELRNRARELLERLQLAHLRNELAQNLSGGQKKLLEIARAMMTRPKLLLMDEPTAGVNPALVDQIVKYIRMLRDELGVSLLIIEHNLDVVDALCEDVIVMATGTVLARGAMAEMRANPAVIEAYLGGGGAQYAAL